MRRFLALWLLLPALACAGTPNMATITSNVLVATPSVVPATKPSSPVTAMYGWSAPTLNTDGSAIVGALTYNVYEGPAGALVKVAAATTAQTLQLAGGFIPGLTYCFAVTAIEGGVESAQSAQVCVKIPFAVPAAPKARVA